MTKAPASPRWIDENGDLCYACREPPDIPCLAEPPIIYCNVKLPPGIEWGPDPDEEEG